jgi:hypothetical protein
LHLPFSHHRMFSPSAPPILLPPANKTQRSDSDRDFEPPSSAGADLTARRESPTPSGPASDV